MRKKYASLTYFKLAEEINIEILKLTDLEEKKGKIMAASQLYFYAGETGLKYYFKLGNQPMARDEILFEFKTTKINNNLLKKIEELYIDLLPRTSGGQGLRNLGAYRGKNSKIYETHREFAKLVIELIENEKN